MTASFLYESFNGLVEGCDPMHNNTLAASSARSAEQQAIGALQAKVVEGVTVDRVLGLVLSSSRVLPGAITPLRLLPSSSCQDALRLLMSDDQRASGIFPIFSVNRFEGDTPSVFVTSLRAALESKDCMVDVSGCWTVAHPVTSEFRCH